MKLAALVGVWILGTGFAFWNYAGKYLTPVNVDRPLKPIGIKPSPVLENLLLGADGVPVVVNFWNPDCACSKFNEPHVNDLVRRFRVKGVRFVTVVTGTESDAEKVASDALSRGVPGRIVVDKGDIVRELDILAAPAAVVFDASGKAVYRGGYNAARFCNDEETAYVAKTLEALTSGQAANLPSLPFYGCSHAIR